MTTDASPTARALLALELVQGSPGITADRLADKLGVSERAARRYVGILREAGIPIESVRGPYGGYRVGRGLRLPPLMFSATEALGLVMAVLDGHHDAGRPRPTRSAARSARSSGRCRSRSPRRPRRSAGPRRPPPTGPPPGPTRTTTTALVQACSDRRRVRIGYRSEAGSEWVVEVDPWAVVVRHGRWYLLCRSHTARRPAGLPDRPGPRRRGARRHLRRRPPTSTRSPCSRSTSPSAGSTTIEVVIDAPVDAVARVPAARARPARAGRRRDQPAGRQHQQPVVVRRAARRAPGAVPDRPAVRSCGAPPG